MKKYMVFDTGVIWTEEEVKKEFNQQHEDPEETFEEYLDKLLMLGKLREGGLIEVDDLRKKKQYKRQNNFIKDRYDRFSFVLPKGYKEKLKKYCEVDGTSMQDFIENSIRIHMKMCDEIYNMPKE